MSKYTCCMLAALFFMLSFFFWGSSDVVRWGKDSARYCDMVKIHKQSGEDPKIGWPDFAGIYQEFCVAPSKEEPWP